ncbi:MAG TPA: uroporphyrinogen-III synthase [Caldimonas sp.]|nr:uroporphyrinogen-III synthase [Caldimonas sp.]
MPLPLAGVRVMVTRAADHARELIDLLEGRGATVEVVPLIHMGPPPHERELQEAIDAADEFAWIVFTSVSGVESFARRRKRTLGVNPHIAAIGPATSEAVANLLGRPPHVVPPRYIAEAIAQALIEAASPGSSMLLVQAQDARPVLAHRLKLGRFDVTAVAAYSTVLQAPADIDARVACVDVVTLASASAVRSLIDGLGLELAPSKLRGRLIACIGPITEAEARRAGLHVELTPERSTVDGLVEALCRYYEDKAIM